MNKVVNTNFKSMQNRKYARLLFMFVIIPETIVLADKSQLGIFLGFFRDFLGIFSNLARDFLGIF